MDKQTANEVVVARVALTDMAGVFFRIGAFSFGGGLVSWMHREVVVMRNWVPADEFFTNVALAQVLPGANVTNLAVLVGLRLRGIPGVLSALGGLLFAPFLAVLAMAWVYALLTPFSLFHAIIDGMTAGALALLGNLGITGLRRIGPKPVGLLFAAATFVTVGVLHWPLLPVVFVLAPLSVLAVWPRKARHAG